jgi:hypothetical protein
MNTDISHRERLNLRKLNKVEGKEKYCVEVSNTFATLEDLDVEAEINSDWEIIRENIKISTKESPTYYELRKRKPLFDNGCSKLLDERKEAKQQWLQNPGEINGDNLNNFTLEASRHFRNKKREHLKAKINEIAANSRNRGDLYRGITNLKKGYQPRNNLVKDANGDLLTDPQYIFNGWKKYFS